MNAETAINWGYAVVFALLSISIWRVSRRRWPSETERAAAARRRVGFTVWDFEAEEWVELARGVEPGPLQMTASDIAKADPLELLYLTRAYDRASAAIDEGLTRLFEELGPPPSPDPMDAGRERLWDAIRDDQQKGEL